MQLWLDIRDGQTTGKQCVLCQVELLKPIVNNFKHYRESRMKTNVTRKELAPTRPGSFYRLLASFLPRVGTISVATRPVVVEATAVPISAESGRVMMGQHEISRKFNKNHVAIKPVKKPPLPDMSLSSFWHAVSHRNNELIITCYYNVIIRNN